MKSHHMPFLRGLLSLLLTLSLLLSSLPLTVLAQAQPDSPENAANKDRGEGEGGGPGEAADPDTDGDGVSDSAEAAASEAAAAEVSSAAAIAGVEVGIGTVDSSKNPDAKGGASVTVDGVTMSVDAALSAIGSIADAQSKGLSAATGPGKTGIDVGATLASYANGTSKPGQVVGNNSLDGKPGDLSDVIDREVSVASGKAATAPSKLSDQNFDNRWGGITVANVREALSVPARMFDTTPIARQAFTPPTLALNTVNITPTNNAQSLSKTTTPTPTFTFSKFENTTAQPPKGTIDDNLEQQYSEYARGRAIAEAQNRLNEAERLEQSIINNPDATDKDLAAEAAANHRAAAERATINALLSANPEVRAKAALSQEKASISENYARQVATAFDNNDIARVNELSREWTAKTDEYDEALNSSVVTASNLANLLGVTTQNSLLDAFTLAQGRSEYGVAQITQRAEEQISRAQAAKHDAENQVINLNGLAFETEDDLSLMYGLPGGKAEVAARLREQNDIIATQEAVIAAAEKTREAAVNNTVNNRAVAAIAQDKVAQMQSLNQEMAAAIKAGDFAKAYNISVETDRRSKGLDAEVELAENDTARAEAVLASLEGQTREAMDKALGVEPAEEKTVEVLQPEQADLVMLGFQNWGDSLAEKAWTALTIGPSWVGAYSSARLNDMGWTWAAIAWDAIPGVAYARENALSRANVAIANWSEKDKGVMDPSVVELRGQAAVHNENALIAAAVDVAGVFFEGAVIGKNVYSAAKQADNVINGAKTANGLSKGAAELKAQAVAQMLGRQVDELNAAPAIAVEGRLSTNTNPTGINPTGTTITITNDLPSVPTGSLSGNTGITGQATGRIGFKADEVVTFNPSPEVNAVTITTPPSAYIGRISDDTRSIVSRVDDAEAVASAASPTKTTAPTTLTDTVVSTSDNIARKDAASEIAAKAVTSDTIGGVKAPASVAPTVIAAREVASEVAVSPVNRAVNAVMAVSMMATSNGTSFGKIADNIAATLSESRAAYVQTIDRAALESSTAIGQTPSRAAVNADITAARLTTEVTPAVAVNTPTRAVTTVAAGKAATPATTGNTTPPNAAVDVVQPNLPDTVNVTPTARPASETATNPALEQARQAAERFENGLDKFVTQDLDNAGRAVEKAITGNPQLNEAANSLYGRLAGFVNSVTGGRVAMPESLRTTSNPTLPNTVSVLPSQAPRQTASETTTAAPETAVATPATTPSTVDTPAEVTTRAAETPAEVAASKPAEVTPSPQPTSPEFANLPDTVNVTPTARPSTVATDNSLLNGARELAERFENGLNGIFSFLNGGRLATPEPAPAAQNINLPDTTNVVPTEAPRVATPEPSTVETPSPTAEPTTQPEPAVETTPAPSPTPEFASLPDTTSAVPTARPINTGNEILDRVSEFGQEVTDGITKLGEEATRAANEQNRNSLGKSISDLGKTLGNAARELIGVKPANSLPNQAINIANIESGPNTDIFVGAMPGVSDRFLVFTDTTTAGRALLADLNSKITRLNERGAAPTLNNIIPQYAPASDGNNPAQHAGNIAGVASRDIPGFTANTPISSNDLIGEVGAALIKGFGKAEEGIDISNAAATKGVVAFRELPQTTPTKLVNGVSVPTNPADQAKLKAIHEGNTTPAQATRQPTAEVATKSPAQTAAETAAEVVKYAAKPSTYLLDIVDEMLGRPPGYSHPKDGPATAPTTPEVTTTTAPATEAPAANTGTTPPGTLTTDSSAAEVRDFWEKRNGVGAKLYDENGNPLVNEDLLKSVALGIQNFERLNPGYRVVMQGKNSGRRYTGKTHNHRMQSDGLGGALDLVIRNSEGSRLTNHPSSAFAGIGTVAENGNLYQKLFNESVIAAYKLSPSFAKSLRFGGYFYSSNGADLMHIDVKSYAPHGGGTTLGGFNEEQIAKWGFEANSPLNSWSNVAKLAEDRFGQPATEPAVNPTGPAVTEATPTQAANTTPAEITTAEATPASTPPVTTAAATADATPQTVNASAQTPQTARVATPPANTDLPVYDPPNAIVPAAGSGVGANASGRVNAGGAGGNPSKGFVSRSLAWLGLPVAILVGSLDNAFGKDPEAEFYTTLPTDENSGDELGGDNPNYGGGGGTPGNSAAQTRLGYQSLGNSYEVATSTEPSVEAVSVLVQVDADTGDVYFDTLGSYVNGTYYDESEANEDVDFDFLDSSLNPVVEPSIVLDETNSNVISSDGTYAPVIINGVWYESEDDPRYVYRVEVWKDGQMLELPDGADSLPSEGLFGFLGKMFSSSKTFTENDIYGSTRALVDPNPDVIADEYYVYRIYLIGGDTREVSVPQYTSYKFLYDRFASIGFNGDVLTLVANSVDVPPQEEVGGIISTVANTLKKAGLSVIDIFRGDDEESGALVTDLGKIVPSDDGIINMNDIKNVTVITGVEAECPTAFGVNDPYLYEMVIDKNAIAGATTDQAFRAVLCGGGSKENYVKQIAAHFEKFEGVGSIDQGRLYEIIRFAAYEDIDISKLYEQVETETPANNTETEITETEVTVPTEKEAFKPNLTNTISFEVKAVGSSGSVLSDWTSAESIDIGSGVQLYFRWNGSDYAQCLPFLNDNGNYALTVSNRAMINGNTESEGYNVPERTATYRIECGGQRNNEFGVDYREVEVTVQ